MAEVTATQVKELRDQTGAGMMDCKKALTESDGDLERALEWLRKKGISKAAKLSDRAAQEGLVDAYLHMGGRIGVLLQISCETDFVAKTDDFKALLHDISMHIAASAPRYVRREQVPADELAAERRLQEERARQEGKPEAVVERMVSGRMDKFLQEICLEEQPFVKDPDRTIGQLVQETSAKLGEKMEIRRFARFQVGE